MAQLLAFAVLLEDPSLSPSTYARQPQHPVTSAWGRGQSVCHPLLASSGAHTQVTYSQGHRHK